MMCCVALRVGNRLCLVRFWLGGFVFAVVNEGRVYRSPFVLRPRLGWASRQRRSAWTAGCGDAALLRREHTNETEFLLGRTVWLKLRASCACQRLCAKAGVLKVMRTLTSMCKMTRNIRHAHEYARGDRLFKTMRTHTG